jgi:hypothetical protein
MATLSPHNASQMMTNHNNNNNGTNNIGIGVVNNNGGMSMVNDPNMTTASASSRKRKEPSPLTPTMTSATAPSVVPSIPSPSSINNNVNGAIIPNIASPIAAQFPSLSPTLPQSLNQTPAPTSTSMPSMITMPTIMGDGRTYTKIAAVTTSMNDRPTSASALLSALSAATGHVVPSLHTPHLVPSPTHIGIPPTHHHIISYHIISSFDVWDNHCSVALLVFIV